jgi:DNA-binding transcriptional MerR regulator
MVSAEYTATELAEAGGITKRNLRAYRQRGLLDAPRMHGRKGYYGPEHLAQLRTVRALLSRGLSLCEIRSLLDQHGAQGPVDVLLTEPTTEATPGDGRLGQVMASTLETLALQRPGAAERLTELGVLQLDGPGRLAGDSALLARCNALLAAGIRVRTISDVGEAAGAGAAMVADSLHRIAQESPAADARAFVELATFAFRQALKHRLVGSARLADLDRDLDLDRGVEGQDRDADGTAGVHTGIAEGGAEQLARAVDDARLTGEVRL